MNICYHYFFIIIIIIWCNNLFTANINFKSKYSPIEVSQSAFTLHNNISKYKKITPKS